MRVGLANLALVLMIAADETAAATAFADRDGLLAALRAWCADSAATIALHGPMNQWDVSAVTDMTKLFHDLPCRGTFNEEIGAWDTSAVTNMYGVFAHVGAFNQPLEWDTSAVTNMYRMFDHASAFNQPLEFNTSSVTAMHYMFREASAFNQPLEWDTSSVTNMNDMFTGTNALSDCSKAVIYASFAGKAPGGWSAYSTSSCPSPPPLASPPPTPASPAPAPVQFAETSCVPIGSGMFLHCAVLIREDASKDGTECRFISDPSLCANP